MIKNSMFFIGVDLGDKYSYLAILDQAGELIEEARLPSTPGDLGFGELPGCFAEHFLLFGKGEIDHFVLLFVG